MEEALHKLSDEPEWRGDQVLAFIVRIFKVLEDFSHVQWSVSDYGSRPSAPRPTAMYYVKALRANLDDIRRKLPSALQDDSTCIFESSLFRATFFYLFYLSSLNLPSIMCTEFYFDLTNRLVA